MKCTKCNNLLPDDSIFCHYCGVQLKITIVKNDVSNAKETSHEPVLGIPVKFVDNVEPIITTTAKSELTDEYMNSQFDKGVSQANSVDSTAFHEVQKKQRSRYCKKCGTMIDSMTKKCPNCSPLKKKRFCKKCGMEIPVGEKKCPACKQEGKAGRIGKVLFAFLAIAVIIALVSICIHQHIQIGELYNESSKLNDRIVDLKNKESTLKDEINTLRTEKLNLSIEKKECEKKYDSLLDEFLGVTDELIFYQAHVVFVSDDGTNKYHMYECEDFDDYSFWAYNTEAAISKGYRACKKCIE